MVFSDIEESSDIDFGFLGDDSDDSIASGSKKRKTVDSQDSQDIVPTKRRRVTQNDMGVEMLFGTGVNDADQDLLNEFMSEYDEYEQEQNEQRDQERMTRSVRAISQIRESERNKEKLTKGQKKNETVLLQKTYTYHDLMEKVDLDDEGLLFVPIVPPQDAFVNSLLGPEVSDEMCYGCMTGLNVATVSHGKVEDLRQLIIDLHGRAPSWKVAILVSEYFRTEIMKPSNKDIREGETPLNPWSARSVYDHITKHMTEPSFVLADMLSTLRELESIIKSSTLLKIRAEQAISGRPVDERDMFVSQKGFKMLMDTYTMKLRVMNSNPDRMLFGKNSVMDLSREPPGVIRKKANIKKKIVDIRSMLRDFE